jgi:transposase
MDSTTKQTTTDVWRERVTAQQNSGLSIRRWCRDNGLREHSFYWWRARLGMSPAAPKPRRRVTPGKPVEFARVEVEPPVLSGVEPIRLTLIGGREVTLPASMPVERIARLLRAMEGVA